MENASKALIIAGAILLAILLIGLSVYIYNQSSNSIGNTGMDKLAVKKFNSQFEPYEGWQSGAQVKQLIKTIISNNLTYSDDESMQVRINGQIPNIQHLYADLSNVPTKDMVMIEFDRNDKNGMIDNIRSGNYTPSPKD